MVDVRRTKEDAIKLSLRQIDETSWMIGNFTLRRSPFLSDTATWNDSSDTSIYTIEKLSAEQPVTTSFVDSPYIKLIHETGYESAVWSIGGVAVCKARFTIDDVASESATLNFVYGKKPSFETPKVLYHALDED